MVAPMRLLVVGDLNVDLIIAGLPALPALGTEQVGTDCSLSPGGSAANVAAGLAALGAEVSLAARVGEDLFGDYLVQAVAELGVGTAPISRDATHRTGITVALACASDRAFATYSGAVRELVPEHIADSALATSDHVHVASVYLVPGVGGRIEELLARARHYGCTTSLDTGFDPAEEWEAERIRRALRHCDVFLPNEVELRELTGESDAETAAGGLAALGPTVVAKLGAEGSLACSPDGCVRRAPAKPVRAIDTTGCGDTFNAAFLLRWLERAPLDDCMRFANAAGALCATRLGGSGVLRGRDEVEAFAG